MELSWASLQSWGELAKEKLTEAADIAQNKLNEAADQIATRAHPTLEIGTYRVNRVRRLAEGGFSEVFLVKDADRSEELFALKRMVCQTPEAKADAKNELKLLQTFGKHPNVISLLGASATPLQIPGQRREALEVHFLFPLYDEGTVFDAMWSAIEARRKGGQASWPFPERRLLRIAAGTCQGLVTMHSRGLAHRDVKPHNILLHRDSTPVLMDLGSACPARRDIESRQDAILVEDDAASKCSAPYRAPELTEVSYPCFIDERVDVWSMGCTMFAMAFGTCPFESEVEGVKRLAILNGKYSIPRDRSHMGVVYSDGLCELLRRMLVVEVADRPFLPEVIQGIKALLEGEALPEKQPSQGPRREDLSRVKREQETRSPPVSRQQPQQRQQQHPLTTSATTPALPAPSPAAPAPAAPPPDLLSFDEPVAPVASTPQPAPSVAPSLLDLGTGDEFGDFVSAPVPAPGANTHPQDSFADFSDFQSALPSGAAQGMPPAPTSAPVSTAFHPAVNFAPPSWTTGAPGMVSVQQPHMAAAAPPPAWQTLPNPNLGTGPVQHNHLPGPAVAPHPPPSFASGFDATTFTLGASPVPSNSTTRGPPFQSTSFAPPQTGGIGVPSGAPHHPLHSPPATTSSPSQSSLDLIDAFGAFNK